MMYGFLGFFWGGGGLVNDNSLLSLELCWMGLKNRLSATDN